jgi:hypothetical protein
MLLKIGSRELETGIDVELLGRHPFSDQVCLLEFWDITPEVLPFAKLMLFYRFSSFMFIGLYDKVWRFMHHGLAIAFGVSATSER